MKKLLALVLAVLMVIGIAACGQTNTADNSGTAQAPAETQAAAPAQTQAAAPAQTEAAAPAETQAAAPAETQAPETEAPEEEEDAVEIHMMLWGRGAIIPDEKNVALVEEEINKISIPKSNVSVKLHILESGNYPQQVSLSLAGGEQMDLMVTQPGGPTYFSSMQAQNQLTDLTDLLPEYAPDLLEQMPEGWLKATQFNGRTYGVTPLGDKVSPYYFICRQDILDKTGTKAEDIHSIPDLEALFDKVLEVEPDIVPIAAQKTILGYNYFLDENKNLVKYDALGDGDNCLVGIMDGDGTTIKNNYERDEYLNTVKIYKEWYEKGYVYKDALTYGDVQRSLVPNGVCFGYFMGMSTGQEPVEEEYCGYDMAFIELDPYPLLGTSKLRQFTWVVPVVSKEPEAAVKFMNLMYSDADVLNLIMWGIEGVHYQTLADGTIDFLDGEDPNTCGYYIGDNSAIIGNGFLSKVRKGQDPDLREKVRVVNENASLSQYMGFSFSTAGLDNEVAAITAACDEYKQQLNTGLYTEELYDEFLKKLHDVGVDKFFEQIQGQFDEWLASK